MVANVELVTFKFLFNLVCEFPQWRQQTVHPITFTDSWTVHAVWTTDGEPRLIEYHLAVHNWRAADRDNMLN